MLRKGTEAKLCGIAGLALLVVAVVWLTRPEPPDLKQAVAELESGNIAQAEQIARNCLAAAPGDLDALLTAAECAARQGNRTQVEADLRSVRNGPKDVLQKLTVHTERLHQAGALSGAELFLRRSVELFPDPHTLSQLVEILYLSGQTTEVSRVLRREIVTGEVLSSDLPLLSNPDLRVSDHEKRLDDALQRCPADPLGYLGKAALAQQDNRVGQAIELLLEARKRGPDLTETHARLGWLLLGRNDPAALRDWHAQLPGSAMKHPGIWLVLGQLCRDRGKSDWAQRCYWEAGKLAPNSYSAISQLGRLLNDTNHDDAARQLAERGRILASLYLTARRFYDRPGYPEVLLRQLTDETQSLGRLAESTLWSRIALAVHPELEWPRRIIAANESSRRPQDFELVHLVDLSHLPRPDPSVLLPSSSAPQVVSSPRFRNESVAVGIDFSFVATTDTGRPHMRFFEFTGGGVGVIDYDGDDQPDLYMTQGGDPPLLGAAPGIARSGSLSDQLFRNTGTGRFDHATESSGLGSTEYGQGCAVGDFNNDGFSDLYVANIGTNTLYENNGDGTFSELDLDILQENACWTASCAIADLNGDGHPELIDVNHAPPHLVHTEMCRRNGVSVPCSNEAKLGAEQDRLMLNAGNGEFEEIHSQVGMALPDGLGLGLAVTDFDHDGSVEMFVANDGKPNFYFEHITEESRLGFRLNEQAHLYGLALSLEGRAQACMGIAVDDVNGDSLPDLFVTNFYEDSNTLYVQQSYGGFEDVTRTHGLRDSSYRLLGFGTQFIDAELDGRVDLVLTNGDVDDFSAEPDVTDRLWRQRPQFMSNTGQGSFRDLPGRITGDYFDGRFVGRGLAVLDWNRDGLPDFAVSHIGDQAALVTNTTASHGHWVAVTLVGRKSSRDAIGAIVSLDTEHHSWTRTLAAGSGYMASNERRLLFGIGPETVVRHMTVRWPGGHVDEYESIPVDRDCICVESAGSLYSLRNAQEQ